MAKDATIEIIESIIDHPNADRLSICNILGFQCITKKNQFKRNEIVIYVRPDSVFPESEWASEYRKYSPKRIKAIKLREFFSEGVIIPINELPVDILNKINNFKSGDDVSEILGITHYEEPQPQDLSAKGNLPFGIPKTDENRFENLKFLPYDEYVDVTLKIDGQSSSYYYNYETKEFGVLGRKLEIKLDCINRYTEIVTLYDIENKLKNYCEKEKISLVIRGESYGSGLQGHQHNPHAKINKSWAMFSVFLINEHIYANKNHKYYFINVAKELNLPIVPIIEENVLLTPELIKKYSIENNELNGNFYEGVVIKTKNDSFKIINKYYDSLK